MIKETDIIKLAKYSLPGGIHPAEFKSISNFAEIRCLPKASEVILPLLKDQNSNIFNDKAASNFTSQKTLTVGENILAGQQIDTNHKEELRIFNHAPFDGIVTSIANKNLAHFSKLLLPAVTIKRITDPSLSKLTSERKVSFTPYLNWLDIANGTLIERIQKAGIVGLGGAVFPTHVKLKTSGNDIDTLIVNAMECEPYITCDDRMLRELSFEVVQGALIAAKIIGAKKILFGIEDNKPEAIEALEIQIDKTLSKIHLETEANTSQSQKQYSQLKIQIIVAKTKYPSGGEKQLIQLLTGKQVPQKKFPAAIGILVQNVATLFAVYQAVFKGVPLTQRLVTITGDLVKQPGNYWVNFGTTLTHIIHSLDIDKNQFSQVTLGGPLMGQSVTDFEIPTRKSTNCLIFNTHQQPELSANDDEHLACIRCGECETVCPASLLPQQLYWFAQSEQWQDLEQQHLFDCIECGACSYVCPSKIPLVKYYQFAKSEIKHLSIKQKKSEVAKQRFENRENRLARIKDEREQKRKKTAEARKLAANNNMKDPDGKKSAIEAALQRVKAKKEAQ